MKIFDDVEGEEMTRYAVVDLEATDAHGTDNKIIQIGIVIVENGAIQSTYQTDVNPHVPLLARIKELTGLSNNRLKQAPDFSEVASEVHEILNNTVFVAHNAKFDYELLWRNFQQLGYEFELPRIDTVDLARIFYPRLDKYGMEALGETLNLSHDHPHEALSDAYATAELLLKIQKKARKLPRPVLEELLKHADNLLYETKYFLEEQLEFTKLKPNAMRVVHNIATQKTYKKKSNPKAELSEDFAENIKRLKLVPREKQEGLAEKITGDLKFAQATFIEAPTGMGKTYAYLLALLSAGRRLVISTPTKVLQDQLLQDVGAKIERTFGVRFAKLLGTKNYISLEKFSKVLQKTTDGKNFEIFKMKVLIWLTETTTGELDELSQVMANPTFFEAIAYETPPTKGQLHYEQDFWLRAQEQSKEADVIVVNHAYLVDRLADYPETFLEDRVLLVDEAQQLFSILENARQSSLKITDELLKIDPTESQLIKRLQESLVFQLGKKELNLDKIKLDAKELGLSELVEFLDSKEQFIWKEDHFLRASQKDFYNFKALVPEQTKLFMIGATLSLSDKTPVFPELLGFSDYRFFKIAGEVQNNQEIICLNDSPAIKNTSLLDYSKYTARSIADLAEYGFPVLALFTSKEALEIVAKKLLAYGQTVLAQDINGSAHQIKKKFDREEASILLGLGSFWEGVDFDKQNRIIVVIPRLPFATPEDILTKKYASKFEHPFYDFNVPMATLKLQQAAGRVNRRADQRSIVVVLDHRLLGKSYAKRMRKNLEQNIPLKSANFDEMTNEILNFLI